VTGSAYIVSKPVALYVDGSVPLGGAERRFFRLFNYLCENGYDIYLCTSAEGAEACKALGINLDTAGAYILPRARGSTSRIIQYWILIRRTISLIRWLRRKQIHHVHFGSNPGASTFLYALFSGFACPFSVSLVDSIKDYQRNVRERLYVTGTAAFGTAIDCLSISIKTDLCAFLGKRYRSKCKVAPCSFTESRVPQAAVARDIDVSLIARMIDCKGHGLLRKALGELTSSNCSGLVVHVCGSGPLESEIRRDFAAITGHRVHIQYEQDPFRILLKSKVFVSLQDVDNYPSQSLLEAMACGCAIIATDVGLTRQLLGEDCAILIRPEPTALAEALRQVLTNPTLRCTLGANARRVVTTQHTIERFADYFNREVIGTASRNECNSTSVRSLPKVGGGRDNSQ
jgi:glycosyltransferase involved in cell wall biosynthesis